MKKSLTVIIIISLLLLSSIFIIQSSAQTEKNTINFFKPINSPIAYKWHYFTSQDAKTLLKWAKTKEDNSSEVDNGHFTGFIPSPPSTVDPLIGHMEVIDYAMILRNLPSSMDLSKDPRFPAVGNQGPQGSCAAWAVTYYNEGWLQAYLHNWTDAHLGTNNHHLMSPAWTYNKVNSGSDEGSGFISNIMVLATLGGATLYTMPYNPYDAVSWGDESAWREAPLYRIEQPGIINVTRVINAPTGTYTPPTPQQVENLTNAIKSFLVKGMPVNFAIDADQYSSIFSNGNYIISYSEYNAAGYVNHAQTIVGYNDSITDNGDKGAFKVVNSWGSGWGEDGYYWITYKAMYKILAMGEGYPYAFVIFPRAHYQPKLLAVWTLNSSYSGSRLTPIDLGLGSPSDPIQIESSVFGNSSSYNGGNHPFPRFLAVDLTDFIKNVNFSSSNEFFLYAHRGYKKMIINSFHVEYYKNLYIPGHPSQVSGDSPDVPATEDASQSAIVRVYFTPHQSFHTIKINSNSEFNATNGVIAGNGTKDNPYVIGGMDIDAKGATYAIYIGNTSAYFIIEHCLLHNTSYGAGIYLYNTTNGYITKNNFYDNYYGILFSKSYNNTLASNNFYNNTYTLSLITSKNPLYYNQRIYSNNTVLGKPLYYIANANNITLENIDAGYIGVFHSDNITLRNITLNGTDEIFLEHDTNVSLLYSHIENTHWGVIVRYSSKIKVFGNYFIKNTYSFLSYNMKDSVLNNNSFLHNYYGVKITNSYNNTIYHNNFISNKYQAYDNLNNTWSLAPPIGGNYWSDYNGTDANNDGFGDESYPITGGFAKDYYPLMVPWDKIAPKLVIIYPKNGAILGVSQMEVSWKGEDNIGIAFYELKVDFGNWIYVSNSPHYTISNLKDGFHTVYVKAVDLSGNTATAEVSFKVDTIPPNIRFISPQEGSYLNHSAILIKWSVEDETKVSFIISIDNKMPVSLGSETQYLANDLSNGAHTVTLIGTDSAGNSKTVNLDFNVDTIPPRIQWNMSIKNGGWINTTSLTMKWKASDNEALSYSEIKIDSGNWISIGYIDFYTVKNLSQGEHEVTLKVYDKAGNSNTSSFIFKVDTVPPTLKILAPTNNLITNRTSIEIKWNGTDNIGISYYEVRINNGSWKNLNNATSSVVYLEEGGNIVYIKAVDNAGNSKIVSISITLDTQPPSLKIISPTANSTITTKFIVVSWKGNDNTGIGYYEVRIDNSSWINVGKNTSYNFTGLKDGEHTIYIKAVDKAGNFYVTSLTFNIKPKSTGFNFGTLEGATIGLSILGAIIILIIVALLITKRKTKSLRKL